MLSVRRAARHEFSVRRAATLHNLASPLGFADDARVRTRAWSVNLVGLPRTPSNPYVAQRRDREERVVDPTRIVIAGQRH
jgi:hypothetical protein